MKRLYREVVSQIVSHVIPEVDKLVCGHNVPAVYDRDGRASRFRRLCPECTAEEDRCHGSGS